VRKRKSHPRRNDKESLVSPWVLTCFRLVSEVNGDAGGEAPPRLKQSECAERAVRQHMGCEEQSIW
jgi:hypothetical protein